MQIHGLLTKLPKELKCLIAAFVLTLSIGFYSGINFVNKTTGLESNGIVENYLGNENDEDAIAMKFKKSHKEILTLVHNHILSMSIIFLLLGAILAMSSLNKKLKLFLMIEPFLSIILTFGGIYILWKGVLWFKYVIMFSGMLMTLTFAMATFFIIKEVLFSKESVVK